METQQNTTVVIPARFESTRFPGKPLADLAGKPIIQHVYERCQKAKRISHVMVATDNEKIMDAVSKFGGEAVMTKANHQSGTERCAEVLSQMPDKPTNLINVQGDEPLISPQLIDDVAKALEGSASGIVTAISRMHDNELLFSPDVVKAVINDQGEALYFSRNPIPFLRNEKEDEWVKKHTFFQHIGIYGFKTEKLVKLIQLPAGKLEQAEKLEQLRWLENGESIQTIRTEYESFGVDTPADLENIRKLFG